MMDWSDPETAETAVAREEEFPQGRSGGYDKGDGV